jgi:P27 family predicted phage terminase small subunit
LPQLKGKRVVANPRKPDHLKLVTGNPGKRPISKDAPKPKRQIPSAPAHLSDRAKVAWGMLSVLLDRIGVLTEADPMALEQLCETYADILAARQTIQEEGRYQTVETKAGGVMVRVHPAVSDVADSDRRFRAWLNEFGLTPAARSKVRAADGDEEADPLAKYL